MQSPWAVSGKTLKHIGYDECNWKVTHIVNSFMYEAKNKSFEQLDKIASLGGPKCDIDFSLFSNTVNSLIQTNQINPLFPIIEGEAIYHERNSTHPCSTIFMLTGGLHNCVGLTFWGSNENGDNFVGLVHFARFNQVSSIDSFLDVFMKYSTRRITLHTGYKSEHLKALVAYLTEKGFIIDHVFVGQAYHEVVESEKIINIYCPPQYFGVDEIDVSKSVSQLIGSNFMQLQIPSNIILHVPTGNLVPVTDTYLNFLLLHETSFRKFIERFRVAPTKPELNVKISRV